MIRSRIIPQSLGLGAIAALASLLAFATAAYATPTPPPVGTSPQYFAGRIDQVRMTGSDTTYFAMAGVANLYNRSGLPPAGCTIDTSNPTPAPEFSRYCARDNSNPARLATTGSSDVLDNFDHDEVLGATTLLAGRGITQLCQMPAPSRTTDGRRTVEQQLQVDMAQSSRYKDAGSRGDDVPDCADSTFLPFAKDGIATEVFPGAGPAQGLTNFSKATLQAIYCNDPSLTTLGLTRISDWSQVPGARGGGSINLFGVFNSFDNTGIFALYNTYIGCPSATINDGPLVAQPSSHRNLLANQAQQINDVSVSECTPGDTACVTDKNQRALYFISVGRNTTSPRAGKAGLVAGSITAAEGIAPTSATIGLSTYPISIELFNVYRPSTLRGSAAGFLNWVCDTKAADHGIDQETGVNYNTEIGSVVNLQSGFVRRARVPGAGPAITGAVVDPAS